MAGRLSSWVRDGLLFDVRDTGPVDGDVVVCLHGFPQDGTAYDDVAQRLAAHGLRVLVPDQRGYSPGARPAGRSAYVLEELAADVVALLDAAGVQGAHLVGHDWGGAVAWFLGSRRSDRVRSLTVLRLRTLLPCEPSGGAAPRAFGRRTWPPSSCRCCPSSRSVSRAAAPSPPRCAGPG